MIGLRAGMILMVGCSVQISCSSPGVVKKEIPPHTSITNVPADSYMSTASKSTRTSKKGFPNQKSKHETFQTIVAMPTSTIQIDGDSTLKKYSTRATELGVRIKSSLLLKKPEDLVKEMWLDSVLLIPVSGIKPGNGILDGHLSKALKAKDYPEWFSDKSGSTQDKNFYFVTSGTLSEVSMECTS